MPQITQQKLFVKRTPRGETRIHMSQSKGSVYERPRGHHLPHPCSMFHRGKCHSVSEMGSIGSWDLYQITGGGFFWTPRAHPAHLLPTQQMAWLHSAALQRGREERSWNGAVTSWSHCRGLGCCQSGLCRTHRLGLSGGRAQGHNGQATPTASLCPLQS